MALRFKCKCGKLLNVPFELADKKVACPACRRAYRVPADKFPGRAAAAPTKTPVAAAPAASIPSKPAAVEMDLSSIDPLMTPSELNLLEGFDPSPQNLMMAGAGPLCPQCKQPQPEGARICVRCGIDLATGRSVLEGKQPVEVGYARGKAKRGKGGRDAIAGPTRGYWTDAFVSFLYPVRSTNNAVTFLILAVFSILQIFLVFAGLFGFIGSFIISGWFAALFLNVVHETASGSEDLPGIRMEDGFMDDIVKPSFKYIGAVACAMAPAAAYAILLACGVLPGFVQSQEVLILWIAGGIFVWPMLVMLFAFDAMGMILRVDLIISTIFRTVLPYLSLWLMLLLVGFTSVLSWVGSVLMMADVKLALPQIPMLGGMIGRGIRDVVELYLTLVAMRQIGLYYLHFKKRFTLIFE